MSEPIRVVRGQPSEHDVAALISVLLILRRRHRPAGESTRASPASWTRSRAYEAPGAWSSGRPSRTQTHLSRYLLNLRGVERKL